MKTLHLSLLMLCLAATALAQVSLVKDINTTQTGGTYLWPFNAELVEMNGVAYFAVSDGVHGLELWRSDGTGAGTRLVRDANQPWFAADKLSLRWITLSCGKSPYREDLGAYHASGRATDRQAGS